MVPVPRRQAPIPPRPHTQRYLPPRKERKPAAPGRCLYGPPKAALVAPLYAGETDRWKVQYPPCFPLHP